MNLFLNALEIGCELNMVMKEVFGNSEKKEGMNCADIATQIRMYIRKWELVGELAQMVKFMS